MHYIRTIIFIVIIFFVSFSKPFAMEGKLSIKGFAPEPLIELLGGRSWTIYLDGIIDPDSAKRFKEFLIRNNVPYGSQVKLNSLGGSLFAGMELGKIFREHGFSTHVGVERNGEHGIGMQGQGMCFSACAMAYLGGQFRYLNEGARFGVHRFYFNESTRYDADVAQIISASVVAYLREMEIDVELFSLASQAGRSEIFEPSQSVLVNLNVINDGYSKTTWTIEAHEGNIYLKGERYTKYGLNRYLSFCVPGGTIMINGIFSPQGRDGELLFFSAHSFQIDEYYYRMDPYIKGIKNGLVNVGFLINDEHVERLLRAKYVGILIQGSYESGIFFGFDQMPFQDAQQKFLGIVENCS